MCWGWVLLKVQCLKVFEDVKFCGIFLYKIFCGLFMDIMCCVHCHRNAYMADCLRIKRFHGFHICMYFMLLLFSSTFSSLTSNFTSFDIKFHVIWTTIHSKSLLSWLSRVLSVISSASREHTYPAYIVPVPWLHACLNIFISTVLICVYLCMYVCSTSIYVCREYIGAIAALCL